MKVSNEFPSLGGHPLKSCHAPLPLPSGALLLLPARAASQVAVTGGSVRFSALWSPEPGILLTLTREYSAESGELMEVVHTSSVRGGWVGGRM